MPTKIFKVCMFGDIIGWMKNFREKIGKKIFFECVCLDKNEGK